MPDHVILLSIPGLRKADIQRLPALKPLAAGGDVTNLVPSFPCVTCPVQVNMTTGRLPREHGVVANGFYWREKQQIEMWTAWNDVVERPQIWDMLHQHDESLTSAAWFGLLTKGAAADLICTPAPIHNPDGSESLWCYTQPTELYGTCATRWGISRSSISGVRWPGIQSTAWIADSAVLAARQWQPNFFYIYLPHLDYAAQKFGPDSPAAEQALVALDDVLAKLFAGCEEAYGPDRPLWIVASEYTIVPVDHVTYPNRVLRSAGWLEVRREPDGEHLDLAASRAWALVDHQFSHVFVADRADIPRVADLFRRTPGIAQVLVGDELGLYELDHPRSGEIVLVSAPNSWQAYYYWLDDGAAPAFARTVDIHRKPGYDPVELFFDPATRGIPLDASLVRGSHGAPAREESQRGVIIASEPGVLVGQALADTDVYDLVLRQFGI